jgi:hypothetical protein
MLSVGWQDFGLVVGEERPMEFPTKSLDEKHGVVVVETDPETAEMPERSDESELGSWRLELVLQQRAAARAAGMNLPLLTEEQVRAIMEEDDDE